MIPEDDLTNPTISHSSSIISSSSAVGGGGGAGVYDHHGHGSGHHVGLTRSFDSFPSTFTNDSLSSAGEFWFGRFGGLVFLKGLVMCFCCFVGLDQDLSQDEQEEKASRIAQVLELQNTLDGELVFFGKLETDDFLCL